MEDERTVRIDAHNHVWLKDGTLDRERAQWTLKAAERLQIDRVCISCPVLTESPTPEEFRAANDAVLQAMASSDKFLGFCFVNPGYARESLEELERCIVEGGMVGIKLYHQYFISDPVQTPVLERAVQLGIPVLMHAGKLTDAASIKKQPRLSNAAHFITAADRFPDTIFIQAHIGGGGDWEWNLRVLEESSRNHYIDTSGSVVDAGIVPRTVAVMGPDRVLFATDMSFEEGVGKVLDANLSEEVMEKVFWRNMQGVLARRAA